MADDDVIYQRNKRSDDFLMGVPSADLTAADLDVLEPGPRTEFEAYIESGGKGWKDVRSPAPQTKKPQSQADTSDQVQRVGESVNG